MLSIQTESSSISRACVGLTELARRCSSPVDGDGDPWPDASRNSKPKFDGDKGGDGVDVADLGKLSGCCQAEARRAISLDFRAWPELLLSARRCVGEDGWLFPRRGVWGPVPPFLSSSSSPSSTKICGMSSCGTVVMRADCLAILWALNFLDQYLEHGRVSILSESVRWSAPRVCRADCLDVLLSAYLQSIKEPLNSLSTDRVVDSLETSPTSQELVQPNVHQVSIFACPPPVDDVAGGTYFRLLLSLMML
jgi:hypothetical protein